MLVGVVLQQPLGTLSGGAAEFAVLGYQRDAWRSAAVGLLVPTSGGRVQTGAVRGAEKVGRRTDRRSKSGS